tara:strand:- start:2625 stop:2900 length:276 start_codon:yes stop_codon:yes gene_type:complete
MKITNTNIIIKKPKKYIYLELYGITGAFALITAYILLLYKLIEKLYMIDLLNMYGSISMIIVCYNKETYSPMIVDIIWIIISISSFIKNIT